MVVLTLKRPEKITINPAKMLHIDKVGNIEIGKDGT